MYMSEGVYKDDSISLDEYIEEKIKMLIKDFKFDLQSSDIVRLYRSKSKIECDNVAHTIFNSYL